VETELINVCMQVAADSSYSLLMRALKYMSLGAWLLAESAPISKDNFKFADIDYSHYTCAS
jgi:hypothetical protein